ncbi:MAG: formate dehydrogenase-N subunit alpha [Armatimonadetes bacterium 13_1_40CM_64_14]|nr:MAG: formate dehydrogenase-N subunit alpha [Armatimonadetes bacterium 13_1_40CM_64_14]
MASLAATFGRGAMTNGWTDIANADVILAMGGNPAENHPVGFRFVMEAKRRRGAKLVAVDPRFQRTAAVADHFVQIRAGTDIAFLGGLINYALQTGHVQVDYVKLHTNAPFIVKEGYSFDEKTGLFSGWDKDKKQYDTSTWQYEVDAQGNAQVDPTLQHPRSVFQLMKAFYARYTPQKVSEVCGCDAEAFTKAAEIITSTYPANRAGTIMYALGWTHHSFSVQLIKTAAMLQLLLGNVGMPGGGVNALRGHANIQGGTDMGMGYHNVPGYMPIPKAGHVSMEDYLKVAVPKPLRPNSVNFWSNTPKLFTSQLKAFYGAAATKANQFGYTLHPRLPEDPKSGKLENWSWAYIYDHMAQGQVEGLVDFGMNPVCNGPNSRKMVFALSQLKWLVVAENFETETTSFWKSEILALAGKKPEDVKTEVFLLPAANFAEKSGSFTNSSRWAQWKYKALDAPGQAKPDQEIIGRIFTKVRELYKTEGGTFPDPVLGLDWSYTNPVSPAEDEVAREVNGKDLTTGQQLASFSALKDDGTTSSGNWLYCGSYTDSGNMMMRRSTEDPTGLGRFSSWTWSWPANRRIMYNRASADAQGKPWDPSRPAIVWNGKAWVGDVPDYPGTSDPEKGAGAFIVLPEGVARLFAPGDIFKEGPFPEFYEPVESPVDNPMHPGGQSHNPAANIFKTTQWDVLGTAKDFPIVGTTYRLTEHFHYWTKNHPRAIEMMPEFFVEIPVELGQEMGIKDGERVRVTSARGHIEGKALLTKRIKPMTVAGKKVYQIGMPIHWGFIGLGKQGGSLANITTPPVVDPNSFCPEYKGFLVKLEKV